MKKAPLGGNVCRILQQCEVLHGGREGVAAFLGVHARGPRASGSPPVAVRPAPSSKAVHVILAEHERRAKEKAKGPMPRRRRTDH